MLHNTQPVTVNLHILVVVTPTSSWSAATTDLGDEQYVYALENELPFSGTPEQIRRWSEDNNYKYLQLPYSITVDVS